MVEGPLQTILDSSSGKKTGFQDITSPKKYSDEKWLPEVEGMVITGKSNSQLTTETNFQHIIIADALEEASLLEERGVNSLKPGLDLFIVVGAAINISP